tara:strand:+ start:572 stop:763 length:192 start_codon:yes stop_codon:yes gene_type:complete
MIKNMFKMFFPSFFEEPEKAPPKKRGRPKGSKNQVKKATPQERAAKARKKITAKKKGRPKKNA